MPKPSAMRDAFLRQILARMENDDRVFFVSADFGSPVLDHIRENYPERFINVGVAEQNLINVSAGLAIEGFKVFAYAIAPFITMRCFEQLRVNLALLSEVRTMNVNLIGVGAGYSYVVSGPTHQCYEDLSLVRSLPNFKILSPSDHVSAEGLFDYCMDNTGPKYLRFDAQVLSPLREEQSVSLQKKGFDVLRSGADGVIISTGYMTHTALAVAEQLAGSGRDLAVIDLVNLTGFDEDALATEIRQASCVFSLEEGFEARGGLDALLYKFCRDKNLPAYVEGIGVRPGYQFELGTRAELHEQVGVGVNAVAKRITSIINDKG